MRSERRLAALAAAGGFLLGAVFAHRGLYNDGIFFVQWFAGWPLLDGEKDVWLYPHLLYAPLARSFHAAAHALSGLRVDASLKLFSAIFAGAAGAAGVRFFGAFLSLRANAVATALVLLCPSVWFFAGATEIHTLHLAAAAFAFGAAARPPKRFGVLAFASGVALVAATHVSGVLLVPAMLCLHERARRRGDAPSNRSIVAMALLAGIVVASIAAAGYALDRAFRNVSVITEYFERMHPGEQAYATTVLVELVLRSGILVPVAIAGAALCAKREPLVAIAVAITLALYAHMIGTSHVAYQGGYNLPIQPLLALPICIAASAWRPAAARWGAVAAIAAQAALGAREAWPAHVADPNRDVADAIAAVVRDHDAFVIFLPQRAVDFDLHELPNLTRLYLGRVVRNVALLDEPRNDASGKLRLSPEEAAALRRDALAEIDAALAAGRRAFVSASALAPDGDRPQLRAFAGELSARFSVGAPIAGADLAEIAKR